MPHQAHTEPHRSQLHQAHTALQQSRSPLPPSQPQARHTALHHSPAQAPRTVPQPAHHHPMESHTKQKLNLRQKFDTI